MLDLFSEECGDCGSQGRLSQVLADYCLFTVSQLNRQNILPDCSLLNLPERGTGWCDEVISDNFTFEPFQIIWTKIISIEE